MNGGARQPAAAVGVVVVCAGLWGLWWWPVRLLEQAGLGGAWIAFAMTAGALPPVALWAALVPGSMSARAVAGAALTGVAVALYALATYHTDFLRAVLLFYLAPAWSTLIEMMFFGRRWSRRTGLALTASLAGVLLITGASAGASAGGVEGLGVFGDWLALASGLAWSAGAALIFSSRRAELSRVIAVATLGGAAAALAVAFVEGAVGAGLARLPGAFAVSPAAFLLASAYIGVVLAGTMWGAFRLAPATMSYLLSVEILSGVGSAALILGEPFGTAEAAGAICIIGAAATEMFESRATPPRPA